jgi:hypothetical protein
MNRILPLAALEVFVWAMLLLCMFFISKVVFDISLGTGTLIDRAATQVVRTAVSGAIILLWLVSWKKITDRYFWRAIRRKPAT